MTTADLAAGRPIPDIDDLRLLAELVNNVSIPLANAAWNARMSQSEAAARLVEMAERGLPLRLMVEGDRQALWHITNAGPATSAVPAADPGPAADLSPAAPPVQPPPTVPPTSPVPPHEQVIAGAVPLGRSPFGKDAGPPAGEETQRVDPGTWPPAAGPAEVPAHPEPAAAPRWASLPVAGPGGEQLTVTVLDVLDPGDDVLTEAGYHMEPGQRAILVHSALANSGPVPYYPVGDLNLVLENDSRTLLGRAAVAVGTHPAFGVGVLPGHTADGWSVFLVPVGTVIVGIKWCLRPDLPQTILSWPIAG